MSFLYKTKIRKTYNEYIIESRMLNNYTEKNRTYMCIYKFIHYLNFKTDVKFYINSLTIYYV